MSASNYLGILTQDEIQALRRAVKDGMIHPVAALALSQPPDQVATNTEQAARQIVQKNQQWLAALKSRLVDCTDFTNASSALGEIRSYGYLLETRMKIEPRPQIQGKKVVPEFQVDAGDGAVIVEVHSRQLDRYDANAAAAHHANLLTSHDANVNKELSAKSGNPVTTMEEFETAPLGAPKRDAKGNYKKGDSILTNAISRIASIKSDEKQIDPDKPFLLWLDFQDPTVWGLSLAEEQLAPLYTESKDGEVGSGALWFALYGRKGDPMIETDCFTYRVRQMLHDGRFYQTMSAHKSPTRVSAVIYSLPHATVLMENPSAVRPLPPRFRAELMKTPFFCLDRSICEWKQGLCKSRIEIDRETVEATAKALLAFSGTSD